MVVAPPLIPALGGQKQASLCELEASLVYRSSYRIARATQSDPVLKNKTKNKQAKKVLGALVEALGSVPSNLMMAHNCLSLQLQKTQQPGLETWLKG